MLASRFEFDGTLTEEKGQQFVNGQGIHSHLFTKVHRIETHGFASMPVKGAKGILIYPNGSPDEAYVFGGEHPDLRPTGLPEGGKAIYDSKGNILKFIGDGAVLDLQSNTFTVTAGSWTINIPAVTLNGNLQVNGNVTATGSITDGDGNNGA